MWTGKMPLAYVPVFSPLAIRRQTVSKYSDRHLNPYGIPWYIIVGQWENMGFIDASIIVNIKKNYFFIFI